MADGDEPAGEREESQGGGQPPDSGQRLPAVTSVCETVFETIEDAVYVTDREGTITYVNSAFEELTGYDAAEAIGETPRILRSSKHSDAFYDEFWETILAGEQWDGEFRDQRYDGEEIVLETTITPITDSDGTVQWFVAVARDVTERRQYVEELTQAREQLRQIIDLVPDLIFAKNREGEYLLANETTAAAYGLTPEEVEGRTEAEIIPDIEDSEQFRRDDQEVIESGEPKEIPEETLTTADGETWTLRTTKIPYEVAGTDEDAVLGYARDVTALKAYENRLKRQRDNLEMLNQVVRHDIRNDLQVVLTYADLLEEYVEGEGREYLDGVQESTQSAISLTKTARELAEVMLETDRGGDRVSLERTLRQQVEELRSVHPNADFEFDGDVPDVDVLADEMLNSVFRNLLVNAVKHNDKQVPEVTIRAETNEQTATVRISDNGPGIPEAHIDDIFEQGETVFETNGTGLGLHLVESLIDAYGGRIWVENDEPEGAIFSVELPLAE